MTAHSSYTEEGILLELDRSRRSHNFIFPDGGKELPAKCRLTAYCDTTRWAIVLEELCYATNSPGFRGMVDMMPKIGNCVSERRSGERGFVAVLSDAPDEHVFLDVMGFEVNPDVRAIRIRNEVYPIDLSPGALEKKGIVVPSDGALRCEHLLWSLLPEYADLLMATEAEKRGRLPADLPKFIQLDEWNQPLLITKRLMPSQSETFQLLAKAMVAGDASLYRPTLPPNTDWKNWLGFERV